MTTNGWQARSGPRRTSGSLGIPVAQSTMIDASTREARLKRLILVGALASFLSLFGLTIALDHQSAVVVGQTTQQTIARNDDNPVVTRPQIRTRTS